MKTLLLILSTLTAVTSSTPVAVAVNSNKQLNINDNTNNREIINLEKQFQGYFNWGTDQVPSEFQFEITTNFNLAKVDDHVDALLISEKAVGNGILFGGFISNYVQAGYLTRTVYDYQTGETSIHITPHGKDENAFYQIIYTASENPYGIEPGSQIKVNIESGHGSLINIAKIQQYIDALTNHNAQPIRFNNVVDEYALAKEDIARRIDQQLIELGIEGDVSVAKYESNFLFNLMKKDNIDTYFVQGVKTAHHPFIPHRGETLQYKMIIEVLQSPNDNYVDHAKIEIPLIVTNPHGYDISLMQKSFNNLPTTIEYGIDSLDDFKINDLMIHLDNAAKAIGLESMYGDFPLNFFQEIVGEPGLAYYFNDKGPDTNSITFPNVQKIAKNKITFKTTDPNPYSDLVSGKELSIYFNIRNTTKTKVITQADTWKSGYEYNTGYLHVDFNENDMINSLLQTIDEVTKPENTDYIEGSFQIKEFYLTRNGGDPIKSFNPVLEALNNYVNDRTVEISLTGYETYWLFVGYAYTWYLNGQEIYYSGKHWDKNPNLTFHVEWTYLIKNN
ncbi:hypothetical protein [Spiroplasma sp. DGKH1]|uniref:hypothetical protein n=1 Tax=Spiroplasma sp. DGKH1 TaxID=3050074 RepID=UPI0034C66A75